MTYAGSIVLRNSMSLIYPQNQHVTAYTHPMDAIPEKRPHGWLQILEESEAEIAAGLTVSGDEVMRGLRESLARLEENGRATRPSAVK